MRIDRTALVALALALVAGGGEIARLAPGPADLEASAAETERRVARSEVIGAATTRIQNAWGEILATGGAPKDPCADATARSLFARAVVFGPTWRDAAQAARAERDRLVEIAAAPTVMPLIGPEMTARVHAIEVRVEAQEIRYAEAVAWQSAYMLPPRGCDLSLEPVPGLANAAPLAPGESVAAAVIGLGGGRVCPTDAPADGTVVVTSGVACVTTGAGCDCAPARVDPAAVLAP